MTDPETTPPDLLSKADVLIAQVEHLTVSMSESNAAFMAWHEDLTDYARRSRNLLRVLLATLIGVILLLIAVGWVVLWNRERIEQIEKVAVGACEDSNEVRQRNIVLWEEVFRLRDETRHPEQTAEDLERIRDFRVFIQTTFAPRDCSSPL